MEVQGGGEAPAPSTEEAAMNEQVKAKLIAHRARKGANAAQSAALLEELIAAHGGWNLHYALCYQGFAGERGAEKAVFGEG
jgi:hypothetical protein